MLTLFAAILSGRQTTYTPRKARISNQHKISYKTIEKVVKKIFFSAPKASKIGDRQVLVEPTMALLWRPLDVLLFRRPKKYFFHNFFDGLGY
jgi:hypothetical protein